MKQEIGHSIEAGKPALLGIPWDENSSFLRGSAAAPPLIRAALLSESSNLWTENGADLGAPSQFIDAGDLPKAFGEEMFCRIEETVLALLDRRLRPFALGGDHSITYPVVRTIAKKHANLTILDFDAHPVLSVAKSVKRGRGDRQVAR